MTTQSSAKADPEKQIVNTIEKREFSLLIMILNTARDGVSLRVNTHTKAPGHEAEARTILSYSLGPLRLSELQVQ